MIFNTHSQLVGQHAFLSASRYHWIGYTEEKLASVFASSMAARRGTELHAFAHEAIRLGIKLPANGNTLNSYVNDAIGYRMSPEQVLYYSDNAFGTADAIAYRKNKLRIHDLKTGVIRSSEHQLEVYAALFCLEYGFKPNELSIELRIYQNDEIKIFDASADDIFHIMSRIRLFDQRIEELKAEANS